MSRAVEEGLIDLSLDTGVSSNFITVSTIKIIHKLKDVNYIISTTLILLIFRGGEGGGFL